MVFCRKNVRLSEEEETYLQVFVGGLDPNVSAKDLNQVFNQYGQLVHVKIPVGKRCGFLQLAQRSCAKEALRIPQGTQFGGKTIIISWGRCIAGTIGHRAHGKSTVVKAISGVQTVRV